jgi:hypothetical protein
MEEEKPPRESEIADETITVPLQGLPPRKASNFTTVYANSVYSVTSPWDFSLIFGQTIIDDPHDLHVEQRVSLTLSLHTAKALAEILIRNLREYEEKYGELRYIPLPPQAGEPSA